MLDKLIQDNLDTSRTLYIEHSGGTPVPVAIGYSENKKVIVPFIFKNNNELSILIHSLRALYWLHNVTNYTVSFSSHYINQEEFENEKSKKFISKMKNKKNAFIVVVYTQDEQIMRLYGEDGSVVLEESVDGDLLTLSSLGNVTTEEGESLSALANSFNKEMLVIKEI